MRNPICERISDESESRLFVHEMWNVLIRHIKLRAESAPNIRPWNYTYRPKWALYVLPFFEEWHTTNVTYIFTLGRLMFPGSFGSGNVTDIRAS